MDFLSVIIKTATSWYFNFLFTRCQLLSFYFLELCWDWTLFYCFFLFSMIMWCLGLWVAVWQPFVKLIMMMTDVNKKPSCCWNSRSYSVGNIGVGSYRAHQSRCRGLKVVAYRRVPRRKRALPIQLFRYFCGRMYRLESQCITLETDRQTDRQTDGRYYDANANSRSYCVHYDNKTA